MSDQDKSFCVNFWLKYLPLTHDKKEGVEMNELLMKLLLSNEA